MIPKENEKISTFIVAMTWYIVAIAFLVIRAVIQHFSFSKPHDFEYFQKVFGHVSYNLFLADSILTSIESLILACSMLIFCYLRKGWARWLILAMLIATAIEETITILLGKQRSVLWIIIGFVLTILVGLWLFFSDEVKRHLQHQ